MAYDALGRLIAARWPYATVTLSTGQPQVLMKVERYYYDGVRRLQTIVGNETMENDVVSVPPESWQTESEYVYGPDYVDEFVLQSGPNGQAGTVTQGVPADGQRRFYMLQDADYNVMAILDESGNVWEQYQWDPYGTLAVKDTLVSSGPTNRVGHQGLFFYRFDGSTGGPLTTTATGLYYNRNRWYSPKLGRFTSKDPNETAMDILTVMAKNGDSWSILAGAFNASGHFRSGMNLYGYLQSNPITGTDPLGLYDPFEAADDAIGSIKADKVGTLALMNQASGFALLGMRSAVRVAGSVLGVDLFLSARNIIKGEGDFWDYLQVGAAAAPVVGAVTWKIFKLVKQYNILRLKRARLAANYAKGMAFEKYVLGMLNHTKNTTKISDNGVNAIPDILTSTIVGDIKDVKKISMSPQLRTIANWAQQNGRQAVLYVADTVECISGPVQQAFKIVPIVKP